MKVIYRVLTVSSLLAFAPALYAQSGVKTKGSKFYNITEAGYGHGMAK